MSPNMRAIERLETVLTRLKSTEKEFDAARRAAKRAKDAFEDVKTQRLTLFQKAFSHIAEQIGTTYRELTRSAQFPMGGQAYLDTEDSAEPFLSGLKYHAMPPLKRFRDMEHLSGGEKTIAALALLFAIHSFQPSPFFVLDEVDAALDNVNVSRVAKYVKEHAGPGMQFIVISLKSGLFQESEGLVGVMRDQSRMSSRVVSLDVSCLPNHTPLDPFPLLHFGETEGGLFAVVRDDGWCLDEPCANVCSCENTNRRERVRVLLITFSTTVSHEGSPARVGEDGTETGRWHWAGFCIFLVRC